MIATKEAPIFSPDFSVLFFLNGCLGQLITPRNEADRQPPGRALFKTMLANDASRVESSVSDFFSDKMEIHINEFGLLIKYKVH